MLILKLRTEISAK